MAEVTPEHVEQMLAKLRSQASETTRRLAGARTALDQLRSDYATRSAGGQRRCPDPLREGVVARRGVVEPIACPAPMAFAHHSAPGVLGEAESLGLSGGEQIALCERPRPQ